MMLRALRLPAALAGLSLLLMVSAQAAGFNLGSRAAKGPISVSADSFSGDFQTKVGTYSGNVVVSQGNFKLRADRVRIAVGKDGKAAKILASGHVVFAAPSGTASGDTGVYDLGPRVVTLSGDVVLTKDKNVMRGTQLTVNLDNGKATLGARGMAGGRVQGLFTPPKQGADDGKK